MKHSVAGGTCRLQYWYAHQIFEKWCPQILWKWDKTQNEKVVDFCQPLVMSTLKAMEEQKICKAKKKLFFIQLLW